MCDSALALSRHEGASGAPVLALSLLRNRDKKAPRKFQPHHRVGFALIVSARPSMAAAPIAVWAPLVPASPESPIMLLANEPLVAATAFLRWEPAPAAGGGPARVQLALFQMVRSFGARLFITRTNPADLAAARIINLLTLRFQAAFWSRVLTELVTSGLVTTGMSDSADLRRNLLSLTLVNPGALAVSAADWSAAPPFAIPAGGGGAGAAAARARMASIRFFSLVDILSLDDSGADAPWELLALIVGALGACHTQAARQAETAQVQIVGQMFVANNHTFAAADAGLAARVKPFFAELTADFPLDLMAPGVTEVELCEELQDRIQFNLSEHGRSIVEAKRLHLLQAGPKCVPAHRPAARCPHAAAFGRRARIHGVRAWPPRAPPRPSSRCAPKAVFAPTHPPRRQQGLLLFIGAAVQQGPTLECTGAI